MGNLTGDRGLVFKSGFGICFKGSGVVLTVLTGGMGSGEGGSGIDRSEGEGIREIGVRGIVLGVIALGVTFGATVLVVTVGLDWIELVLPLGVGTTGIGMSLGAWLTGLRITGSGLTGLGMTGPSGSSSSRIE